MNLTYLEELDFSSNPALMQMGQGRPPLRLVRQEHPPLSVDRQEHQPHRLVIDRDIHTQVS